MITVLHFADLHLGVETHGRTDPATGLPSRLLDFLAALDEVVDFALKEQVDLVLFCGDAYKSRDPSQTYQREFAKRIRRLAEGRVPLFLLAGNHDLPGAVSRATAVEIFDTLAVPGVTVASHPAVHRIETRNGPLQIVALPWARRGGLLTREDYKGLSFDEVNQEIQNRLSNWLATAVAELDPSLPTLLAAHAHLFGADLGSERTMMVGRDYTLLRGSLTAYPFDYVALGHIHKRQELSQKPPVVYAGSLQTIDFGDQDEEKGFYLVKLDPALPQGERTAAYEFHPVSTRRFVTIEVSADSDDPTDAVLRAIAAKDVSDAIVRVQIRVSQAREQLVQENEVRRALKDAYFVAAITKDVQREQRIRLGGRPAEGITPLEALKIYLESKNTSLKRAKALLEYAERLIAQGSGSE